VRPELFVGAWFWDLGERYGNQGQANQNGTNYKQYAFGGVRQVEHKLPAHGGNIGNNNIDRENFATGIVGGLFIEPTLNRHEEDSEANPRGASGSHPSEGVGDKLINQGCRRRNGRKTGEDPDMPYMADECRTNQAANSKTGEVRAAHATNPGGWEPFDITADGQ